MNRIQFKMRYIQIALMTILLWSSQALALFEIPSGVYNNEKLLYQVQEDVESSATHDTEVSNNATMKITAVGTIVLKPGFHAKALTNGNYVLIKPVDRLLIDESDHNWIRTFLPRVAISDAFSLEGTDQKETQVFTEYFDGLTRSAQQVDFARSPQGKDVVTQYGYDEVNRKNIEYLPYTESNNGAYAANALTNQPAFYTDPNNFQNGLPTSNTPFAKTVYEQSSLHRVAEVGGAGDEFQPGGGHTIRSNYPVNTAADEVLIFNVDESGSVISGNAQGLYYAAGDLMINTVQDEDQTIAREFIDKAGNVVLKEVSRDGVVHRTYFVLDVYYNLRYKITPEGTNVLIANGVDDSFINNGFLRTWAYSYDYDYKDRLISVKDPGTEPVYHIYDEYDRIVMTQDGNRRDLKQWFFTKYDVFGNNILDGVYTHGSDISQGQMQVLMNAAQGQYETLVDKQNPTYSNNVFPNSSVEINNIYVYGTYAFTNAGAGQIDALVASKFDDAAYGNLGNTATLRVNNVLTCRLTKVLNSSSWLTEVLYYDKKFRTIQAHKSNIMGGVDVTSLKYTFDGLVTDSYHKHSILNGNTTVINEIKERFEYDDANRLVKQFHQIDAEPEVQLVENIYNELGQLTDQKLYSDNGGAGFLQSVDYRYSIQGWLKSINDPATSTGETDLFSMSFHYNQVPAPCGVDAQFSGNITAMNWKSAFYNQDQNYCFGYDGFDRLTEAKYSEGTNYDTNVDGFSMAVERYDANGNIKELSRKSASTGSVRDIDDLTYTHTGNRLKTVDDQTGDAEGFSDNGNISGTEYQFDHNGNLTQDVNKGITSIEYNILNLPSRIEINNGAKFIEYEYSASGDKLKQTVSDGNNTYARTYIGNYHYYDNTLSFVSHGFGRVVRDGVQTWQYEFFLKDHLGNSRVSFMKDPSSNAPLQIQEDHFYPYGMKMYGLSYMHGASPASNRYVFTGKELQDDLGLNWYDFQARHYDPVIGLWTTMDPMREFHSGYNFVGNNPMNAVDPDGTSSMLTNPMTYMDRGYLEATGEPRVITEDELDSYAALLADAYYDAYVLVTGESPVTGEEQSRGWAAAGIFLPLVTGKVVDDFIEASGDIAKQSDEVADVAKQAEKSADTGKKSGRAGKQAKLKELADDPKLGKADRGWLKQEKNAISRKSKNKKGRAKKNIRNPPGKELAHERGREAAKGFDYSHSNLQDADLHRLQHKHDKNGTLNKERPVD